MSQQQGLGGFDAVILTSEGRTEAGSSEFTEGWEGKDWRFVSEANRQRFAADPERFVPAYDGRCALAASLGKDAPGSPAHAVVRDGRLFLFKNAVAKWLFGVWPGRVEAADERWAERQS